MAQHDYIIANQSGAAFRADLNNGLAAIVSQNSGAAQPSTTYAYQWWADTTTGLLKIRNAANNAWITVGTLASANLGLLAQSGGTLTGALLADDSGTAALPAIAFDGDPNTGIYSPGADQVAISTNGTGRLFVNSSGNVGLGTSSPGNPLTVARGAGVSAYIESVGNGNTANPMLIGQDATGAARIWQSGNNALGFWTNSLQRLTITGGGNVGIGTTSPVARLHIENTAGGDLFYALGSDSDVFKISSDSSTINLDTRNTTGGLAFQIQGTERARIDSSGRLLVGTSSSIATTGGTAGLLQIHSATGTTQSISNWASSGSDPARLVLSKSQGGSVGTQGIVNSAAHIGLIRFAGDDGTNFIDAASISAFVDGTPGTNDMPGRLVFSTTADGASSPTERMRITSAGQTVVGPASINNLASYLTDGDLYVSTGAAANTGTVAIESLATTTASRFHFSFTNPNGVVGSISTNASATAYTTSSDYRLKENVVLLTGAIDRLQQIPVHRFNFIADPDTVVDGFIAHEAQAVVPECATGSKDEVDDDGNPVYQGIDQSKLVPLLTAALQEAIGRIEILEAEVAALKGV